MYKSQKKVLIKSCFISEHWHKIIGKIDNFVHSKNIRVIKSKLHIFFPLDIRDPLKFLKQVLS